jgi:hypothetical protein
VSEDQPAVGDTSASPTEIEPSPSLRREDDSSLGIGSLKGEVSHE